MKWGTNRAWRYGFIGVALLLLLLGLASIRSYLTSEELDESEASRRASKLERSASEAQRLEQERQRSIDRALQELKKAPSKPHFRLLDASGALTEEATRVAGLSPEEVKRVNTITSRIWERAALEFGARAQYDEDASDPGNSVWVYRIPALPDRGADLRSALNRELMDLLGTQRQELLATGFDDYAPMGDLGKCDVRLELNGSTKEYSFKYIDTETGRPSTYGTHKYEEFTAQFGNSFNLEDGKSKSHE